MTMNTYTNLACAALVASLTTLFFAEVAQARETTEKVEFSYLDSELASAERKAEVYERLRKVARRACRGTQALDRGRPSRQCRKDLETKLLAQLRPQALALASK